MIRAVSLVAVMTSLHFAASALAAPIDTRWVASWGVSPQAATTPLTVSGATIREFAHLSLGGRQLRLRLSNIYGHAPVVVGASHLALRGADRSLVTGSDHTVTFRGHPAVVIPAGGEVLSDALDFNLPDLADLAISLYLPGDARILTEHSMGLATTYISPAGDYSASREFVPAKATQSVYLATDIEVVRGDDASTVVALGDSITDGALSTPDANHRWTDYLAQRLLAASPSRHLAVINAGISGNRVLTEGMGIPALARLDHDVLSKAGVRYLIVFEGINDIGSSAGTDDPAHALTAERLIGGYQEVLRRAHAAGLRVYGATLTPFAGGTLGRYDDHEHEALRQAVNGWIRTSGAFDAVIDFDAAVRDPALPAQLMAIYNSGDNLHMTDAGFKAMADAIDPGLFRREP